MEINRIMKEMHWKELSIKDRLAIMTALIAFFVGWTLVGIAAFVPLFLSEASLLAILGQSMIYCASVFGITSYFANEQRRLRSDVRDMMDAERKKIVKEFEDDKS